MTVSIYWPEQYLQLLVQHRVKTSMIQKICINAMDFPNQVSFCLLTTEGICKSNLFNVNNKGSASTISQAKGS